MQVVIRRGKHLNQTLATVNYDGWGQNTLEKIILCDTWQEGWTQTHGITLFIDSGTVFTDWNEWKELLRRYPHQGLIAHLIWHPGQLLHLDEQCWLIDTTQFDIADLAAVAVSHPEPIRSIKNMHDDYTPLYVRPGTNNIKYAVNGFGQGLIARQLKNGRDIVNWNHRARTIKHYCYADTLDLFSKYNELAEHQLWVLNNQTTKISRANRLITPGSGMLWMLNVIQPTLTNLQIVDISNTQIDFCQQLWNTWNGVNYGEFAWNYIQRNQLTHFEIDLADITDSQRNEFKNYKQFVTHINQQFQSTLDQHNVINFTELWNQSRDKTVNCINANLINWVLDHKQELTSTDAIWCSNITEYRWTLLHNTDQELAEFHSILNDTGVQVL